MATVYTQYTNMYSDFVISQSEGRPLYQQIIEQIKGRVAVGELAPGEEIPSIRQLAADLCVSVITVKRAYLELERDGVVVTQHGKGSMIANRPDLACRLYGEELAEHLEQAVRLAALLGLTQAELAKRLREAAERPTEHRTAKER